MQVCVRPVVLRNDKSLPPYLPSGHLPHLDGLVSGGRHYVVTIWHDGYRRHIVIVAWTTQSRV